MIFSKSSVPRNSPLYLIVVKDGGWKVRFVSVSKRRGDNTTKLLELKTKLKETISYSLGNYYSDLLRSYTPRLLVEYFEIQGGASDFLSNISKITGKVFFVVKGKEDIEYEFPEDLPEVIKQYVLPDLETTKVKSSFSQPTTSAPIYTEGLNSSLKEENEAE